MMVSSKPASSRAPRIAPTWPSIIPLGATTCGAGLGLGDGDAGVELEGRVVVDGAVAATARRSARGSCTRPGRGRPSATRSSPNSSRSARSATWAMPSGSQAPVPTSSLAAGTPKRMTPRDPDAHERASPRRAARRRCAGSVRAANGSARGSSTAFGDEERRDEVVRARASSRRRGGAAPACDAVGGVVRSGNTPPAYCEPADARRAGASDARRGARAAPAPALEDAFAFVVAHRRRRRRPGHDHPRVARRRSRSRDAHAEGAPMKTTSARAQRVPARPRSSTQRHGLVAGDVVTRRVPRAHESTDEFVAHRLRAQHAAPGPRTTWRQGERAALAPHVDLDVLVTRSRGPSRRRR